MVIGAGGQAYAKYVCPSARYRGICSNRLYIRRDRLEKQLLDALSANLRRPEMLQHALESFQKQLECRIREIRQAAESSNEPELRKELENETARAKNLVEAIAVQGISPLLSQELAHVEGRIAEITRILNTPRQAELKEWSFEELRQFVVSKAENFVELLRGDPKLAKEAIQRHVRRLLLKPKRTAAGPVFEVAGDIDLFASDSSVMLNNPVEGIAQHYIPFLVPFGPMELAAGPKRPGTWNLDTATIDELPGAINGMGSPDSGERDSGPSEYPEPIKLNPSSSLLPENIPPGLLPSTFDISNLPQLPDAHA
jgi:hypothetical protein